MSRRSRVVLVACLTVFVALPLVAGVAAAQEPTETDLELEEAIENDTDTDVVAFTFVATANDTVSADEVKQPSADSDVTFIFQEWENLATGEQGTDATWDVRNGTEYRVEYEAEAGADTEEGLKEVTVAVEGSESTMVEETLTANVVVLSPELSVIEPDGVDLQYGPDDDEELIVEVEIDIGNEGDGVLKPDEMTADSVWLEASFDENSMPERIEAGESEPVVLEITVTDDVLEDTYEVSGSITDTLGNEERFGFDATVLRPPYPAFEDEPLHLGDVLVGETTEGEITIEEVGGHTGLDGVEWYLVGADRDAQLDFDDMTGFDGVSTDPDGEDTVGWTIEVNEDVDQHETLSWSLELEPVEYPEAVYEVDVEARVIYPPEFGSVSSEDVDIVFDEPKETTGGFTETVEVDVENIGDLDLDFDQVSLGIDEPGIDATVVDEPTWIAGLSEEAVEIEVAAESGVDQGRYDLAMLFESSDPDVDPVEYSTDVTIHHEIRLGVSQTEIRMGDVAIGEDSQRLLTIEEQLGYQDIENLEIAREDGPETWLEITDDAPIVLDAGDSSSVVFEAAFDTDSEVGSEYQWRYVVTGEGIDSTELTITATSIPLDLEPIRHEMETYTDGSGPRGDVASGTAVLVDDLDTAIRDGGVPDDDISRTLTFGEASLLYLEATEEATAHLEDDAYDDAQDAIIRAAAAYNTMTYYAETLEDGELRGQSETIVGDADDVLDELIDRQVDHYETHLESGEMSLIEEAVVERRIASIVTLQGDDDRAAALERDADDTFETYRETVADAESAHQDAQELWDRMESDEFVTVAGQPLLLNPAAYDTVTENREAINAAYADATESFEAAGETSRAEAIAAEHDEREGMLEVARLSLFVSLGVYLLVVLGITVLTARGMYRYVQDARESVTGDFLV